MCILTKCGVCRILENCTMQFLNVKWSRDYIAGLVGIVLLQYDIYSIPTAFCDCSLRKSCDSTFFICFYTISSFPQNLVRISFLSLRHDNIENWYYKRNSYYTKWDRKHLLQSYCIVWQKIITKCLIVWQLLQS